jgi:hypothetical protein
VNIPPTHELLRFPRSLKNLDSIEIILKKKKKNLDMAAYSQNKTKQKVVPNPLRVL